VGTSHFEVTERVPGATVVQVVLETGRRNQIRLSACLAGHPLVGETQYTPTKVGVEGPPRAQLPTLRRQALHAAELVVRHPQTDEPLALRAPVPEDLARWLRQARKGAPSGGRQRSGQ
jgi:23S rRNA pseudouridine1911/1915/1917 synthase